MSVEENKAVIRRLFEEVLSQGKLDIVDQIVAPDAVDHTPLPGQPPGRAGIAYIYTMLHTAFPDLHISIEDLFGEGDRVAIRWTIRGTHTGPILGRPPTGQPFSEQAIVIFRVVDGQMAERWAAFVRTEPPPGSG